MASFIGPKAKIMKDLLPANSILMSLSAPECLVHSVSELSASFIICDEEMKLEGGGFQSRSSNLKAEVYFLCI